MRGLLFLVLLVVAAASASDARKMRPRCRNANEEWTSCGTACEPSCDQREPRMCTMQCVQGCQCISGYLRNADGRCVEPCDCFRKGYKD